MNAKTKARVSKGLAWMAFTLDTDDDEAQAKFVERHGHLPRVFLRDGAILKVGPIEEGE